jgi:DNA-binding MarR family transcriptional regulator
LHFLKEDNTEKDTYNVDLTVWKAIGDLHHKMLWLRQKELSRYNITARQLHVLEVIESLGSKATISTVAKAVSRNIDVISRQTMIMEEDGLINRTKEKPKSRLLTFKLTEKSLELLKIGKHSDAMRGVLLVLTKDERRQLELILKRLSIKLNGYTSKQIKDWSP